MLLIMCGYPFSGKSTFLDMLVGRDDLPGPLHIVRPSDWYPENIKDMGHQERQDYQIAAWDHARDKALDLLKKHTPSDVIALDTCGASPQAFRSVVAVAEARGHKLVVLWIATPRDVCSERGDKSIVDKYKGRFEEALAWYQKNFHKVIPIRNGTVEEWRNQVPRVVAKLSL